LAVVTGDSTIFDPNRLKNAKISSPATDKIAFNGTFIVIAKG
jgi:hypothetical protein